MSDFNYPHNDTSGGERKTRTAQFNKYRCAHPDSTTAEKIVQLRNAAYEQEIPTACDETLNFICNLAQIKAVQNILELGTGTGISGICLLECTDATLTTVEKNEQFYNAAKGNFNEFGLSGRVVPILGDAGEVINTLTEESFDFIFLDSAKVQYVKYLSRLVKLLKSGGVLVADDVLLYGWVTGEEPTPPKRAALVRHIKEYIDAAISSNELSTTIIDIGDGIALSVKKSQ